MHIGKKDATAIDRSICKNSYGPFTMKFWQGSLLI